MAIRGEPVGDDELRQVVHFSGEVQGVGFRYTTHRIARRHAVTGFVRNLPDGRVELIVEGQASEIAGFLRDVRSAFADNITELEAEDRPSENEFTGFEIRG